MILLIFTKNELYISALDYVRMPRFRSIVHLTYINKSCFNLVVILSHLSDSAHGRRGSYFQAQALYLSLKTR